MSGSAPQTWSMASAATSKKVDVINGFYMSMREKYTQVGRVFPGMLD